MIEDLIKFFKLEEHEELFKKALRPKSVGGSDEFKRMAREGDILLDKALTEIYKEIQNTGILNEQMTSFHNQNCLKDLAYLLKIDTYISGYYNSDDFSDNDIKEAIEALLFASSTVNKSGIKDIVLKLLEIAEKNILLDVNYKGRLLELYQANNYELPEFIQIDAGGPPNNKIWQSKLKDDYFGTNKEYISDMFPKIQEAEKDVARKMLSELAGISMPSFRKPRPKLSVETTVVGKIAQSLTHHEIIFSKLEKGDFITPPQLSKNTGETLLEWVERKMSKNPFSMLVLLSGRLSEISGASWFASLEFAEMALLNIKIEEEHFFEIGMGPSRSKARKAAAKKIIRNSKLIAWLYQNKKDEVI